MAKSNLWFYSSEEEINHTAKSLLVLGGGMFKRAKIVRDLNQLKEIDSTLNESSFQSSFNSMPEFCFSYLDDCIKILVFFENYMKAELILGKYCVHAINKQIPEFEALAKKQFKEPILLKEIEAIEPFDLNLNAKIFAHRAIKETTLGVRELIGTDAYRSKYQFDQEILAFLIELNTYRNKLHFYSSIEFQMNDEFLNKIAKVDNFLQDQLDSKMNL